MFTASKYLDIPVQKVVTVDMPASSSDNPNSNDVPAPVLNEKATSDVTEASHQPCSNDQVKSHKHQQTSAEVDIVEMDEKDTLAGSHDRNDVTEMDISFEQKAHSTDDDMISEALGPGPAEEELSRCCTITLTRHDFWTLKDTGWLNDQVRLFVV